MSQSRYEYYKKYRVDAESVDDFLRRYTNCNAHQEIAPHKVRLESYAEELKRYGFCYMTKSMSVTGQPVTYYPKPLKEEKRC